MPEQQKKTPLFIFLAGIGVVLLVIVMALVFNRNKINPKSQKPSINNSSNNQQNHTPQTADSQTPTTDSSALYMGVYKEEDVLFYDTTNDNVLNGTIIYEDGTEETAVDYRTMDNMQILYTPSGKLFKVLNFFETPDKKFLYVSLLVDDSSLGKFPDNLVNYVYRIALNNLTGIQVWSNQLKSNIYNIHGAAYVIGAGEDKAIALSLMDCFDCYPQEALSLVLNNRSRAEKRLGHAGEFSFNVANNTFTYRKTKETKQPCQTGPMCQNGQQTVYVPTGSPITEPIP